MAATPKVNYAGQKEKQKKGEMRVVDPGVQQILMRSTDASVRDMIEKVAKAYDLPAHGITVLGGNPYVNVTGLDDKVQRKWLTQGWVKTEKARMIQHATDKNGYLAGCEVTIELFNPQIFNENVKMLRESMTAELLKELRESHTVSFASEGWASPKTCQAIAYDYVWSKDAGKKVPGDLLVENVNMMAERKASNRAKRAAVGVGLTSVEEVIGKDSQTVDVIPEDAELVEEKSKEKKKKKTDLSPEQVKKAVKKVVKEKEKGRVGKMASSTMMERFKLIADEFPTEFNEALGETGLQDTNNITEEGATIIWDKVQDKIITTPKWKDEVRVKFLAIGEDKK